VQDSWNYDERSSFFRNNNQNNNHTRNAMRTFIKMVAKLDRPVQLLSDEFLAVAMFSGIGLLLTLVVLCFGVQGVWL
jgi:hypothetical protein